MRAGHRYWLLIFGRLIFLFGLALNIPAVHATAPGPTPPPASGPEILKWAALSVGFEELLVPTAATSAEEDAALKLAILKYRARAKVDDFGALEFFWPITRFLGGG